MSYKAIYKCRLCEASIPSVCTYEIAPEQAAIAVQNSPGHMTKNAAPIRTKSKRTPLMALPLNMCHNCKKGSFGLATFAGFEPCD